MRIIFVRHGHPNYIDDCLTELGHLHAAAAAKRLSGEGIEKIYSSTCGRALETAGYTAKELGLSIEHCDFMREISWGSIDGKPISFDGHPWDTVNNMVAKQASILDCDWMHKEPFVHNSLVPDVQKIAIEVDNWLQTLGYVREGKYYKAIGNTNRTIAAFGHGGASAAILSHMFNLPFPFVCSVMGPNYTGITVVTLPDGKDCPVTPRFEILNDARHIKGLTL